MGDRPVEIFRIESVINRVGSPPKAHALFYNSEVRGSFSFRAVSELLSPPLRLWQKKYILRPTIEEYLSMYKEAALLERIENCGLSAAAYEVKMLYPFLNCCLYYTGGNKVYKYNQVLTTDGHQIYCSNYGDFMSDKNKSNIVNLLKEGFSPHDIHTMLMM